MISKLATLCRFNVDMLKLIQLGMTFVNAKGTLPTFGGELCVWQFNFRYATQLTGHTGVLGCSEQDADPGV